MWRLSGTAAARSPWLILPRQGPAAGRARAARMGRSGQSLCLISALTCSGKCVDRAKASIGAKSGNHALPAWVRAAPTPQFPGAEQGHFCAGTGELFFGTGSISPVNTILPETAPRPKRPCSRRMAPMRRRPSVLRARLARLPAPVTKAQRQRERALRNASARRRRPLTRDWRISRNRNLFLNADGYNVVVYPAGRWWSFRVSNWLTEKILAGDRVLVSMDAAKLTAFDAYDLDERARRLTGILSIAVVRAT